MSLPRFIEIAVNLGDPMFRGIYREKQKHPDDLENVLQRAEDARIAAQIITAGSLAETREVLDLTKLRSYLYCTAGVHPTRSDDLFSHPGGPTAYIQDLRNLIDSHTHAREDGRIVAVGECGLDYDRLHFASKEAQQSAFELQLNLAQETNLPLFLHSRAAHSDFVRLLRPHLAKLRQNGNADGEPSETEPGCVGVVHSFTGTTDELKELLELGLYVGVNGCSLKTQDNIDMVREIPLHRIMLETDAPWCDLRPTHASATFLEQFRKEDPHLAQRYSPLRLKPERWSASAAVKGRNEPCNIGEVAAVVARLHNIRLHDLAEHAFRNATRLFRL
ncbi:hypothetical protein MYAM1_002372 [Malassezia yamatoensis]|uniref:Uncharacterized protein n=1 Tax=Malassezia yamatoensis TaxID=253288 RepID=A0AAJ6CGR6_9BASI|nr:hypothetical protein MYAM1_002372 [Malassezia yamatoensis]